MSAAVVELAEVAGVVDAGKAMVVGVVGDGATVEVGGWRASRSCSAALIGDELVESANTHASGTKAAARIKNPIGPFSRGVTPLLCSMPLGDRPACRGQLSSCD